MGWHSAGSLAALLTLAACAAEPAPSAAPDADATPGEAPSAAGTAMIPAAVLHGIEAGEAAVILETALGFERTRPVHAEREYRVAEIRAVDGTTFGGSGLYARVLIEFREPIDHGTSGWPDEAVCAIGRESNDITGIAWLVSFATEAVEAYSPQWDYAIACIPGGKMSAL